MISAAPVLLFCGIALAACLAALTMALVNLHHAMSLQSQALSKSQEMVGSLTKLAAAKDITAFQALEAPSAPMGFSPLEPMDDESIARRMMAAYSDRGIDPSLALAKEDDPLEEFFGSPE